MFTKKNKYNKPLRILSGGGLLFLSITPLFSIGFSTWVVSGGAEAKPTGQIEADTVISGLDCVTLNVKPLEYYPGAGFPGTTTITEGNITYTLDAYVDTYTLMSNTCSIDVENCKKAINSFAKLDDENKRKMSLTFNFSINTDYFSFGDFYFIKSDNYEAEKDSNNVEKILIKFSESSTITTSLNFTFSVVFSHKAGTIFPAAEDINLKISVLPGEYE